MIIDNQISTATETSSDAAITTVPAVVTAITLRSGTTDSSIVVKDGGSGGTIRWALSLDGTTAAGETTESISFPHGLAFTTDLYADITGTGALAYIAYHTL